ncbi:GNAT family N-acetyltransferase [Vibrio makurazakiensis]|uniref:GNAT family N-acetyltransferase n=1 Tax=Vibrio makurazakiensis TaxID=2910250 RepID=UPI003D13FB1C
MEVSVKRITWQQALPIRHQVLWSHKPIEFCKVESDDEAWHFGAVINGEVVCCASVFIDGSSARLRKFATLEQYQGQGIGSKVVRKILSELNSSGFSEFWCDARESAVGFYQRLGMTRSGERFFKSNVPYFKMRMSIRI